MQKNWKKDIFNLCLLILVFFIIYFSVTRFDYLFGSNKDWNQQHWLIPEYFRSLFYKNLDLFPDFAFNLGSGQNIYNFSYYGFLNPIILISYSLPFISMRTYIIASTIFMLLLSVALMYFFVKKKTNTKIAFISSFLFLMATPLIYHAHRHIMFINYMPFLILGYYGVDKYFKDNSKWLLTISVFLMIMTSYFFSVSGIVSIVLYGIYCYIKINKKISFKSFVRDGIKFLIPILIGVLMSGILIVPTFYSLLNGRSGNSSINLWKLFLPDVNVKNLLYSSYSLGLSSFALFSLIDNLFNKREDKFLSISLICILISPIILYILNGFLYVDSKVLITFLPLFIILISNTLVNLLNRKVNYKLISLIIIFVCCLSLFFHNLNLMGVLLIELLVMFISIYFVVKKSNLNYLYLLLSVLFFISIGFNLGDYFVLKNDTNNYKEKVEYILDNDSSYYKIGIYDKDIDSINQVYDMRHYVASVYSSSSSKYFKDFYYNRIGNEVIFRSYGQMPNTNNIFYNMYIGNKYIISDELDSVLYEEMVKGIYKNDNVLPLGYVTNRLMSVRNYNKLNYPDNIYAYLNYIIIDSEVDSNFKSEFEEVVLDYDIIYSDVDLIEKENKIYVKSEGKNKIKLNINNDLDDKILLISFDMDYQEKCNVGDTYIIINGVKNKLTCEGWKYQNQNYTFEYVLSDSDLSHLDISFSNGEYLLSNFKYYVIDKDIVLKDFDNFVVDMDKTRGDKIVGKIDVTEAGYFNLSIPYDNGFNILVDGEVVSYQKTDFNFIGFKIGEGEHVVEIEYKAPFKNIGIILSIVGILLLFLEIARCIVLEIVHPKTRLFKFIMNLYYKYKELVNYLIVGILTTVVSLGSKWVLLFTVLDADDAFELQVAIIISWICAVLFAYISNRVFVFNSKNKNVLKEMISFFGARVLTLVMEMVIMWFFITLLRLNSDTWVLIWTFVTQVLIMIFNYIFSKLFVFKKK